MQDGAAHSPETVLDMKIDGFANLKELENTNDKLAVLRRITQEATKEHEDDREVYQRAKRGESLTTDEKAQVDRYRTTRARLRKAARDQGGLSTSTKLDLVVYLFFAVALYYALLIEYKVDLLKMILKGLRPNFDHLDDDGNWKSRSDEL
ncbi:hypothetical protein DIPPA_00060 [Diplonema papillatum]|nr:hypothetical protein DIPPA_00060 [Diplonema papillatum]